MSTLFGNPPSGNGDGNSGTGRDRKPLFPSRTPLVSFQPEKGIPFSAFAGLCMKRQLISAVRRQNTGKNRLFHDSVSLEESEISSLPTDWQQIGPEAAVILEEESRGMREQVIALLSPLEKETLQLYLKGFSYEEMAKKLKCPEKSVDNALQRVRRKLSSVALTG